MNITIYARYSSDKQTEQSIEGQLQTCHEYAKRNNYTVIGEYIDRALTGKSDDRPAFQRMIADSAKKLFQAVLVYQLDRFSRNRYDSATYKAKLKKNGVRVLSARENISDDASGILMESVLEGMAEYYSVELAQKVKRGMNLNAEKGLSNGGTIPLGFRIVDKRYHLDHDVVPFVRRIFEMYAEGQRYVDITTYLNAHQNRTASGALFNKSSLHTLLKNRKYIGIYKYGDVEIPDGVPRIVSDELFYKVAEIMAHNKKAPGRMRAKEEYLLTTRLFCGHCRDFMVGVSGKSPSGRVHHYYSCNNARRKTCHKRNVPKNYLEDLVVSECRKILTAENINKIASEVAALCERERDTSPLRHLRKQLRENERQRANLLDSLKICDIDSVKRSIIAEISKMETAYASMEKEIVVEQAQYVRFSEPQIKFFLSQLKKGDINDVKYRKMLINVLVNAIYLYDDNRITLVFNVGDAPVTIEDIPLDDIERDNEQAVRSYVKQFGSPEKTVEAQCLGGFCFFCDHTVFYPARLRRNASTKTMPTVIKASPTPKTSHVVGSLPETTEETFSAR